MLNSTIGVMNLDIVEQSIKWLFNNKKCNEKEKR